MKKNRGLLIALSITIGIVLSCAILPLGGLAIILATTGGSQDASTLAPAPTWQEQRISGSSTYRVVVIKIDGIIGLDDSGFLGGSTHEDLLSQIRQAAKDPLVKSVVLRVESPGGGVVASSEIHSALQELHTAEKFLVVSMGNVAASGGYYVAAPADLIYANPDTITGSLGVIISSVNYEETFDKLGLRQVVYKSGKYKDILSPARDATQEEEEILQTFVDEAYQGFVDIIVAGRDLSREEVLNLADGRIYSGRQAQELGLIDELGNQKEAIEAAKTLAGLPEDALVVRYRYSNSLQSLLLSKLEERQQPADPLGIREITQQQVPSLEYRMLP